MLTLAASTMPMPLSFPASVSMFQKLVAWIAALRVRRPAWRLTDRSASMDGGETFTKLPDIEERRPTWRKLPVTSTPT